MSARVEGTDLATLLEREGPLEPERALLIVRQLADALDAARWSRGLVHGRLTPAEVLVVRPLDGSPERVVLSGFGLRRELLPDEGVAEPVTAATDVYALGCLLFTCLTGQTPVGADSVETPDAGLSAGMKLVLRKALAESPEQRYSTCSELAAAAEAALAAGGEQPSEDQEAERPAQVQPPPPEPSDLDSTPPPPTTEPRPLVSGSPGLRWLKNRDLRSLATGGLVVVLAALAAGVIWVTGRGTDDVPSAIPALPATQPPADAAAAPAAAEPPAEAEPAVAEPAIADPDEPGPFGADPAEPVLSRVRGSLVRIDAKTGTILAELAIPSPKLLASDGRSVWVLSHDESGDKLIRIDAATNTVTEIFNADVSGAGGVRATEPSVPTQLAVAGGSAWLGVDFGPVYRFSPGASAGEPAQIEGESPWFEWPVAAAGSLWVRNGTGGGDLLRVDPDTEEVLARISAPDEVVAAGEGFVWAVSGDRDALVRIDTETNTVSPLDAPQLGRAEFAVSDGAVWAWGEQGEIAPDTIVRLDPVTGEVEGEIDVEPFLGPIAAGGGAVWATSPNTTYPSSSNRTLARYDIATGRVERIVVGGTPSDLVFARGSVWVAVPGHLNNDGSPAEDWGAVGPDRLSLTVDRVPFSFRLQTGDSWERFGSTSINKWIAGGQDAEAVIFWQTLPSAENADPCAPLVGGSVADLAAAVASAPGTELVAGPSDVTVGGRAAKHVVVRVREDVGCAPGFFFTWAPPDGGAFWLDTVPGDTIRVWIVDVDGKPFVIEAETRPIAGSAVEQEIQQFVDSIRFD